MRDIPDHYAKYGSASCHCDHTVHIAELVMSQKMAAFVLACVLEGLSLSICSCLMVLACRQETREYMNFGVPSVCLTLAIKKWPGLAGSTV